MAQMLRIAMRRWVVLFCRPRSVRLIQQNTPTQPAFVPAFEVWKKRSRPSALPDEADESSAARRSANVDPSLPFEQWTASQMVSYFGKTHDPRLEKMTPKELDRFVDKIMAFAKKGYLTAANADVVARCCGRALWRRCSVQKMFEVHEQLLQNCTAEGEDRAIVQVHLTRILMGIGRTEGGSQRIGQLRKIGALTPWRPSIISKGIELALAEASRDASLGSKAVEAIAHNMTRLCCDVPAVLLDASLHTLIAANLAFVAESDIPLGPLLAAIDSAALQQGIDVAALEFGYSHAQAAHITSSPACDRDQVLRGIDTLRKYTADSLSHLRVLYEPGDKGVRGKKVFATPPSELKKLHALRSGATRPWLVYLSWLCRKDLQEDAQHVLKLAKGKLLQYGWLLSHYYAAAIAAGWQSPETAFRTLMEQGEVLQINDFVERNPALVVEHIETLAPLILEAAFFPTKRYQSLCRAALNAARQHIFRQGAEDQQRAQRLVKLSASIFDHFDQRWRTATSRRRANETFSEAVIEEIVGNLVLFGKPQRALELFLRWYPCSDLGPLKDWVRVTNKITALALGLHVEGYIPPVGHVAAACALLLSVRAAPRQDIQETAQAALQRADISGLDSAARRALETIAASPKTVNRVIYNMSPLLAETTEEKDTPAIVMPAWDEAALLRSQLKLQTLEDRPRWKPFGLAQRTERDHPDALDLPRAAK